MRTHKITITILSFLITILLISSIVSITNLKQVNTLNKQYESDIEEYKLSIKNLESELNSKESDIHDLNSQILEMQSEIDYYEATTGKYGGIVYVTKSGSKYHKAYCSSLKSSRYKMSYNDAINSGYSPCSRCH